MRSDAPIGDRINSVYSGCNVTYGRGKVLGDGDRHGNRDGENRRPLENEEEGKPAAKKLSVLGKYLGIIAHCICAVIFAIGLIDRLPIMEMFITSYPGRRGDPGRTSRHRDHRPCHGVQKMVKRNSIIRRLPAVETLGARRSTAPIRRGRSPKTR